MTCPCQVLKLSRVRVEAGALKPPYRDGRTRPDDLILLVALDLGKHELIAFIIMTALTTALPMPLVFFLLAKSAFDIRPVPSATRCPSSMLPFERQNLPSILRSTPSTFQPAAARVLSCLSLLWFQQRSSKPSYNMPC